MIVFPERVLLWAKRYYRICIRRTDCLKLFQNTPRDKYLLEYFYLSGKEVVGGLRNQNRKEVNGPTQLGFSNRSLLEGMSLESNKGKEGNDDEKTFCFFNFNPGDDQLGDCFGSDTIG